MAMFQLSIVPREPSRCTATVQRPPRRQGAYIVKEGDWKPGEKLIYHSGTPSTAKSLPR